MRAYFLIILGLTILTVTLAAKPKKNSRDLDNVALEAKGEQDSTDKEKASAPVEKQEETPPKSKKNAGKPKAGKKNDNTGDATAPTKAKKGAKKSTKRKADNDDDGIPKNVGKILKMDDADVSGEIEIPDVDELTTNTDPVELGQKIRNLTDKKKRKALIDELENAMNENKGTLPGRFYRAAYAAVADADEAEEYWNRQLDRAKNKVMNASEDLIGKARAGIGNAFEDAETLAQIDPLGTALSRGESVFLNVLSDATKVLGKITDFGYDAVGNTSKFIRAATFPVDFIPIAKEIKNNFHNFVENGAKRGKFLAGSFSDNGSDAFACAAKDAGKKADEGEELLRRFASKRRL